MKLPEEFVKEMCNLLGEAEAERLETALQQPQTMAFRPNRAKQAEALENFRHVPWSSLGFYLESRPAFTFDPLFHNGSYYVQEPSSMFLEQALKVVCSFNENGAVSPLRCLDLCAAPGGKSTLLRSLLPDGSLLVSNEVVGQRAQVLVENIQKWGHPDCVVTNSKPCAFTPLEGFFDIVVVDAPCSGEGMFRKDNPAIQMWSLANVTKCARLQREIIRDVWPALREGGFLVYSTCTFNICEDENNVAFFCDELDAEVVPIPINSEWGIMGDLSGGDLPVCRFMPHKTHGEGFFLTLLRKKGKTAVRPAEKKNKTPLYKRLSGEWAGKLNSEEEWKLFQTNDVQFAVRDSLADDVNILWNCLHVLSAGIPVCHNKGNKCFPHEALALSTQLRKGAFPTVEVNVENALNYLRRLTLNLPAETPDGFVLITFRERPLGLVKNLGTRANNLYPQNWRIRSGYTSDTPRIIN